MIVEVMASTSIVPSMLMSTESCVAFMQLFAASKLIQPRATSKTSPLITVLRAGANDDPYPYGVDGREVFSSERRRKLVDRTNVYNTYSSPTRPFAESSLDLEAALEEEVCYLGELPGTDDRSCFAPGRGTTAVRRRGASGFVRLPSRAVDLVLRYLPILMPLVAYTTYEPTAQAFNAVVEVISGNSWVAVDGGQYQATIITPAINGLVVPSIALLFATLTSTTINTLRQRQLQIGTSLNTEANDLRMLSTMIDSLPPELRRTKNHLREYLVQYASRVMAESRPGITHDYQMFIGLMDTEMNGFLLMWNKLSMLSHGTSYVDTYLPVANYTVDESLFLPYQRQLSLTQHQRRSITPFLPPAVLLETYGAVTRLRQERSKRLSALQSTYPVLHYVLLALLAGSICTAFLMETNQELLIFLSAIQLRILWSMLIGTFSALAVVNYDMREPFQGNYNVDISADQFYTIREAIQATIQMDGGGE